MNSRDSAGRGGRKEEVVLNPIRKIIGLFLIVFIGLPILFGIIWAAGLTRAVVSPSFVSDIPQKIIAAVPDITDELMAAGRNPDVVRDPKTRAWFEAAAKVGTTPRELLAKTGLLGWMQGELVRALTDVGDILRGKRGPGSVTIDMRPLKKALLSPDFNDYLMAVLKNLPPCDQAGLLEWARAGETGIEHGDLPSCQPDLGQAQAVLRARQDRIAVDVRDEIPIFEDVSIPHFGVTRAATTLVYSLFLIPAVFLLGGSAIAARSREAFFKWSGVSVLSGGLLALIAAWFIRNSASFFMRYAHWSQGQDWSSGFGPLVLEKTRWAATLVLNQLFSPVLSMAGAVCAVGLILFALSFTTRTDH
jgi:hypothetical protein